MISVIVPVYQREEFIRDTIESITDQSFEDIEIIIVDDGSTDRTGKICDELAEEDSRIRVIHQTNQGSNSARAAGIRCATGDYVCFIDSDDSISGDYLEHLWDSACNSGAEIIITGFYREFKEDKSIVREFKESEEALLFQENALSEMLLREIYGWEMVGKLYSKELFEGYYFHEGISYSEDLLTNWELFNRASRFYYDPYCGYYYLQHSSNIVNSTDANRELFIKAFEVIIISEYNHGAPWKLMLNIEETVIFWTMLRWIVSGDIIDDVFLRYQSLLKRIIEEKKKNGISSTLNYNELFGPVDSIKKELESHYLSIVSDIKNVKDNHKKNYIFGCGIWANRVYSILLYEKIDIEGFVVSRKVIKDKEFMGKPVLYLDELESNDAVIVCVSSQTKEEIRDELEKKNDKYYYDIGYGKVYLMFGFEMINYMLDKR